MNKQILTVLGCSSSIALTLLGNNAVEANTSNEYVFKAPNNNQELTEIPASQKDYPFFDCSCNEYNPEALEAVDREGDKAIALYGCDCAGCRRLVRNLEKNPKTGGNLVN
jgi:hypothetical protein